VKRSNIAWFTISRLRQDLQSSANHARISSLRQTTPGSPVFGKPRRLAPDRLKLAKAEFEIMLEQGVIRPSRSPWASLLHIVSKKDGGLRACGDYRALNARTVPDRHSPPHVEYFAQHLHGKRILSKIGLVRAYQQILIRRRQTTWEKRRSRPRSVYSKL
jgi:hypothetical protein